MNNQILTSLSIITSFHNKDKSVIDAFLPIVEYGIATLNLTKGTNHYDLQSLQEQIEQSVGIKINALSLKSLLRKLETSNSIKLLEKGKYFSINEKNKPEQDKYIEAQREQYRNVHKFVKEYKAYSKDDRDELAINEWIFSFIKDYRQLINVDTVIFFITVGDVYFRRTDSIIFNRLFSNVNNLVGNNRAYAPKGMFRNGYCTTVIWNNTFPAAPNYSFAFCFNKTVSVRMILHIVF